MKKVLLFILMAVTGFSAFALSFSEKFPENKEPETIINFFLTECPLQDGRFSGNNEFYETFEYFFQNNKKDWIVPFCKAFASEELKDYHFHFGYPSYWINPIELAIKDDDYTLAKDIVNAAPALVTMRTTGGQFDGAEPTRYAVAVNDVELVKLMLKNIPDVNHVICLTDKESAGGKSYNHTCNLLSFAKSDEMKNLLIKFGVNTLIPYNGYEKMTQVSDDYVNIRDSAGLTGKKIDKLNSGTEVEVIGVDPYYYDIDDYRGHWIKIKYGEEKTGFIFEAYLNQYCQ